MNRNNYSLDVFARTLFGEAEAGNVEDARSIACVIKNRVNFPNWPDKIEEVCLQPWQFSCWNANDPNRVRIANASGEWFNKCLEIAREAMSDDHVDITNFSTHYYATYVQIPRWARKKTPVKEVRHRTGYAHIFFNNIDTVPPQTVIDALEQNRPLTQCGTVTAAKISGVASAGIAGAAPLLKDAAPAIPLLQKLADHAPTAVIVILAIGIGYMVWRRIDDRNNGLR